MKKTVLIFGVSSFVGSNLARLLSDDYRIIGTYHQTPVDIPGITCVPCDVLKKDYVSKLTAIFKPDYTIYAIGMSSLTACQADPKKADALNSAGAANCAASSERYNSKFIYLSSCFVLGGEDLTYREADTPFPNTVYGNSLSSTEFYVQRSCLNYLIFRCCPLYGRSYNPLRPNFFDVLQTALAKNEGFSVDDSVETGFLDISLLAKIIKSTLEAGETNRLLQISSADNMTRYEFAKLYARIFKKDDHLLQPTTGTFPLDSNKSRNQGKGTKLYFRMDTSNIEDLLRAPMPKIEDSLKVTFKRLL